MKYSEMNKEQLLAEKQAVSALYEDYKKKGLNLTMARGIPAPEQLDLSINMLLHCLAGDYKSRSGADCRSYGVLDGIPEAKELFMEMLHVGADEVIVGGNSSLQMMYDTIIRALQLGVLGSDKPWGKNDKVKFLCPAPGYDRHFAMCEALGIEMITVPYKEDGPDMDMIEKFVAEDEEIKGVWCVPQYSNPTGITYSDEVVRRFANLKPKAKDFRIFWDNAYVVHDLYPNGEKDEVPSVLKMAKQFEHEDMIYMLASTSKITFPSAGLAAMAASKTNIADLKRMLSFQNIGPDKINQLRHALFFKNKEGVLKHMAKQAEIIRPKFEGMLAVLKAELSGLGIASWNEPRGGYFIAAELLPGTAKRTVALCKEAGLNLNGAGSVYPYGKDPADSVLRIAPTFAPISEIPAAAELFCISARLAAAEKLLSERAG